MTNYEKYREFYLNYQRRYQEAHRANRRAYQRFVRHITDGYLTKDGVYLTDITNEGILLKMVEPDLMQYCIDRYKRRNTAGRPIKEEN